MSSKRRIRRNSCDGKTRWLTAKEAHAKAYTARNIRGQKVNAYFCIFCSGYHVGHSSRNTGKKIRRALRGLQETRRITRK